MPIPESFGGCGAGGAAREGSIPGGLGAGLLGMRLRSLSWPLGTGGAARGFSKLPSWLTWGNLGLAGGLIMGEMGL
jgi:hypothetical protein